MIILNLNKFNYKNYNKLKYVYNSSNYRIIKYFKVNSIKFSIFYENYIKLKKYIYYFLCYLPYHWIHEEQWKNIFKVGLLFFLFYIYYLT